MKKPYRSSCTILRTFKVTHGTLDLATGKTAKGRSETVTQPCNTPLFGAPETATGVCRSCAEGWEVPDNRFATPEEKAKALATTKKR
jgi:hypothetical protein